MPPPYAAHIVLFTPRHMPTVPTMLPRRHHAAMRFVTTAFVLRAFAENTPSLARHFNNTPKHHFRRTIRHVVMSRYRPRRCCAQTYDTRRAKTFTHVYATRLLLISYACCRRTTIRHLSRSLYAPVYAMLMLVYSPVIRHHWSPVSRHCLPPRCATLITTTNAAYHAMV